MSLNKMHVKHKVCVTIIIRVHIVVIIYLLCSYTVQEHMKSLNETLEAFDGVYYVRYTYDMGSGFRGYSARMDEM